MAYVENSQCDLVSRKGNTFRNFKDLAQWIGENLRTQNAVLRGCSKPLKRYWRR
jgi:hypothetical protein